MKRKHEGITEDELQLKKAKVAPSLELGEDFYLQAQEKHNDNQTVEAVPLYEKSSDLGFLPATLMLASIYRIAANHIPKDNAKSNFYVKKLTSNPNAYTWFQDRTDSGNGNDLFNFGRCFEMGLFGESNNQRDYQSAVKYFKEASALGHSFALSHLGGCYSVGSGVEKDPVVAFQYKKRAAEQGNVSAIYSLGFYYKVGLGVAKDLALAVYYLQIGADLGHPLAQYGLGLCYDQGEGVTRDYPIAKSWYQLSADQGNPQAQNNIGYFYECGYGVEKDQVLAAMYYKLAADQGHPIAVNNLAVCYDIGKGVPKDYSQALKHFQVATDMGREGARSWVVQNCGYKYIVGSRSACYEEKLRTGCGEILLGMKNSDLLFPEVWILVIKLLLEHQIHVQTL